MPAPVQPDPTTLVAAFDSRAPLVGVYDAPDPGAFAPPVAPKPGAGRGGSLG